MKQDQQATVTVLPNEIEVLINFPGIENTTATAGAHHAVHGLTMSRVGSRSITFVRILSRYFFTSSCVCSSVSYFSFNPGSAQEASSSAKEDEPFIEDSAEIKERACVTWAERSSCFKSSISFFSDSTSESFFGLSAKQKINRTFPY